MKLKFAIVGVITVALVLGIVQRAEIARLREVVKKARGAAEEVRQMRGGSAEFRGVEVDTNELERLRGKHLELMRLRSEMPDLRAAARTPEEIKQDVAALEVSAAEARERAELILMRRSAHELSKATESFLETAWYLISRVGEETGKRPSSWAELRQSLQSAESGSLSGGWETLAAAHNFAGVTFEDFEFLPPGSRVIFREKEERRVPDRGWAKFYFMETGDGRWQIKEVVLPDGAFEQWERGEMLAQGEGEDGGE